MVWLSRGLKLCHDANITYLEPIYLVNRLLVWVLLIMLEIGGVFYPQTLVDLLPARSKRNVDHVANF